MPAMDAQPSPAARFSVVICTYNRARLLAVGAGSVAQQIADPALWELIIVDNGSTDTTQQVVEELAREYPQRRIRCVVESTPGSGAARRAGAQAARGEWVAFMDDDARAPTGWLQTADQIIRQHPDLDGLGGPIHPFYLAPKPDWFQDGYETRSWGDAPRLLRRDEAFSGSNMFFRRELLLALDHSAPGQGMLGSLMQFGEDTILFERAWELPEQPKFYYAPNLVMYHAVPARNMHVGYMLRRQFAIGASNFRRNGPRAPLPRAGFTLRQAGSLMKLGLQLLAGRARCARRENWLVEYGRPVAKKLGVLSAALGLNIRFRQREEGKNA